MEMLTPERHGRLLADIDNIARTANVPKSMLFQSAAKYCDGAELEWLKRFPVHQREGRGLVLTGLHKPPPDLKMMAMAAALVRNYVDARVITVQSLLDQHEATKEMPNPTVLLIPNLYVRQGLKGMPAWKVQLIYDLLLSRFTTQRLSVVYVESLDAMQAEFGHLFVQHLQASYLLSER